MNGARIGGPRTYDFLGGNELGGRQRGCEDRPDRAERQADRCNAPTLPRPSAVGTNAAVGSFVSDRAETLMEFITSSKWAGVVASLIGCAVPQRRLLSVAPSAAITERMLVVVPARDKSGRLTRRVGWKWVYR